MRAVILLVALVACRDDAPAPASGPAAAPKSVVVADAPPPPPPPPRREHEVDEQGYGALWIGEPIAAIDHLVLPPNPEGYLQRPASVGFARLTIDTRRETVIDAAISDPEATTRDGITIGTPFEALDKRYGPPIEVTGGCRQYAKAPGIAFCGGHEALDRFDIPAARIAPLSLGEDLAATSALVDSRALRLDDAKLIAPCLAADDDYSEPVLPVGGAVYAIEGGWRRPDGSMLICTSSTANEDASVFEIDAGGHGSRWLWGRWKGRRFHREPATCTIAPPNITCNGTSSRAPEYQGTFADAFGTTFILPTRFIDRGKPAFSLAETRALRRDGVPIDACERRLVAAWTSSVPARDALGMPTDAAARRDYLEDGYAHEFIGGCLVPGSGAFDHPRDLWFPSEPPREPYPSAERRAREKELVGAWHSVGREGQLYDWTFTAGGQRIDRSDKEPYSVPRPNALLVAARRYQFARIDADHFAVSDPGFLSGIHCPKDPQHADLEVLDGELLLRGDRCSMITRSARLVPATCTPGPNHTLAVQLTGDDGKPAQLTLAIADGCYIPDVGVLTYTRVR